MSAAALRDALMVAFGSAALLVSCLMVRLWLWWRGAT